MLTNRHGIEKELLLRFEEQKRFGLPFGLLFMDVDHFKDFNDRHGHDAGDRVLKLVADTLSRSARPFDVFGRWGGEEFVGIMRNVSWRQLEMIGERIRRLVYTSSLLLDNVRLHVSISMGATLVRDDDTLESVVKRADTLMYRSKQAGRNRLTVG
jgi:diguanylate cyclase (GGDEF)-like protein